jgi:heme-degrading monooxygenase HmoA
MDKIEIAPNTEMATLINLFNVEPENQEELVNILKGGAADLLSKQPGYISSSVHRSKDRKHALVYSQWRNQEDFEAVRTNSALQQYFARVREIATFEPVSYEVSYVHRI